MSGEFEPFVERLLDRYVGAGQRMLDVGCGPATYRPVCKGRYIGVDLTTEPWAPGWPREPDLTASGDRLPFRAESFDLVMCKSTLYLMQEIRTAIAEFRRVLKPGGRLLVVDYNRRTQRDLETKLAARYPCWTQFGLRRLVRSFGFRDCRLLSTATGEMGFLERLIRPPLQEIFGTWAIVTGLK